MESHPRQQRARVGQPHCCGERRLVMTTSRLQIPRGPTSARDDRKDQSRSMRGTSCEIVEEMGTPRGQECPRHKTNFYFNAKMAFT